MVKSREGVGYALFMVLIAILLILSAGALVAIHLHGQQHLVRDQVRNVHVRALVDSGIAYAMAKIYEDIGYADTSRLDLDGGTVVVAVSIADRHSSWVDVWASYQGERRALRARVLAEEQGDRPRLVEWGGEPPDPPDDERL